MSQQPKFITLSEILSNSKSNHYTDPKTGMKELNKDYRDVPISVLATAIEENQLQVTNELGRRVLATDGGIGDPLSIKCALDAVKFYDDANKLSIPADHYFEDEHCPLYRFGWPEDTLPNFEEINPHYADDSLDNSSEEKKTNPVTEIWHANAWKIGKEVLKKHPKFSVEQIAAEVHTEMTRRHKAGENGMTGRGDKVPSADTIKRHALTGIKS